MGKIPLVTAPSTNKKLFVSNYQPWDLEAQKKVLNLHVLARQMVLEQWKWTIVNCCWIRGKSEEVVEVWEEMILQTKGPVAMAVKAFPHFPHLPEKLGDVVLGNRVL